MWARESDGNGAEDGSKVYKGGWSAFGLALPAVWFLTLEGGVTLMSEFVHLHATDGR